MTSTHYPRTGFRADINGLRAWAVLTVVLYHFGITGFGGGFQGVDIFFVISGYLMTGITIAGLENPSRSFSILGFYLARAKRIVPALLGVCIFVLLLGWFTLPAPDYRTLAEHAGLSILFLSNFKYWREAGYFDSQSHEKWLLHTWSLSVEWQFYLLFPILVWALWKLKPTRGFLMYALGVLVLASLGASVWQSVHKPTTAFFLLPSRAWELLVGGLVFLAGTPIAAGINRSLQKLTVMIGFALMTFGFALYSEADLWPSWHASFAVIGAALVIWANSTSVLTNMHWAQWLGERSYSVYLWHWPVVVMLHNLALQSSALAIATGLVISLGLGSFSYVFVEKPTRRYFGDRTPRRVAAMLALTTASALAVCSFIVINKGVSERVSKQSERLLQERLNNNPRDKECHTSTGDSSPGCVYGGKNIKVIVMGDSHANAIVTGVAAALPDESSGLLEFSYGGCPVLLGAKMIPGKFDSNHQCFEFIRKTLNLIDNEYPNTPVLIINRWAQYALGRNEKLSELNVPYVYFDKPQTQASPSFIRSYQDHMVRTMCTLAKSRKVYVLRPVPEMIQNIPATLARKAIWGGALDVTISWDEYIRRQQFVWDALDRAHNECGVEVIDPTSVLCWTEACHGARDGHALYFDDDC